LAIVTQVHPSEPKQILLAPDSFKGTLRAREVVAALAPPFTDAGWQVDECPLADGGEGTLDALVAACGGELVAVDAHDPIGRPLRAEYALIGNGSTAVVETAAASGLHLLSDHERDPEGASTRGTGELLAAAAARAARILVGVGGSATTDGGRGALDAIAEAGGLGAATVTCLCDVRTKWERAASIFGPQKGADAVAVARLEAGLERLAAALPRDPRGVPMTGAAGGLAGGLWAACGAELVPGAPFVLDALGFDERLRRAHAVVTGEGRLDATTLAGKTVAEVALRARLVGVPVHAVVGHDTTDPQERRALGLASVREASTPDRIRQAAVELAAAL
jgi:glycerate kinase